MACARSIAAAVAACALACAACPREAAPPPDDASLACASLDARACGVARGLLAASREYADAPHAFLLASRATRPGVGVARTSRGDRFVDRACARVDEGASRAAAAIDYAFVGMAIDATLVSADADVAPLLSDGGEHDVRLVAIALVRETAPLAAIHAGPGLDATSIACACGDATHVVGEARWGALVSYDARAPRVSRATRAVDLVRRVLVDPELRVRETRVGVLEVPRDDAFAPYLAGRATRPLPFRVKQAEPVAYALRSLDEACPNAFPAPEVAPSPIDFGAVAYGVAATREVRVTSRAPFDVDAVVGARTVRVPARGAVDLPLTWAPDGDAWSCETQTRDEAIRFVPSDPSLHVVPAEQTARVLETIRTGRASVARAEPVVPDPGAPHDAPTRADWQCPPDFAVAACRVERAACAGRPCVEVTSRPEQDGCRFVCRGERGAACRFDAAMECRLRCPE